MRRPRPSALQSLSPTILTVLPVLSIVGGDGVQRGDDRCVPDVRLDLMTTRSSSSE